MLKTVSTNFWIQTRLVFLTKKKAKFWNAFECLHSCSQPLLRGRGVYFKVFTSCQGGRMAANKNEKENKKQSKSNPCLLKSVKVAKVSRFARFLDPTHRKRPYQLSVKLSICKYATVLWSYIYKLIILLETLSINYST